MLLTREKQYVTFNLLFDVFYDTYKTKLHLGGVGKRQKMDLEQTLNNFGVTDREVKIYLAALELGESLPKQLAAKAQVKRTTLYEMLPRLFSKGLLNPTIKGKRRYLAPQDPQQFIERKRADFGFLEVSKPELMALFNKEKIKPKVFFFEGIEGIKKIYEDMIISKRNIRAFAGVADVNAELLEWLQKEYEPKRIKNQIFVRNITNDKISDIDKIMPQGEERLRENRFISAKQYPISLEILIYGDKVGYTTVKKESQPIALLVENKEIADSMKSIFELCWRMAGKS